MLETEVWHMLLAAQMPRVLETTQLEKMLLQT